MISNLYFYRLISKLVLMKKFLILILFSSNFLFSTGQQNNENLLRLEKLVKSDTLNDSTRLSYLTQLAKGNQRHFLNKTISYGLMADSLAAAKDLKPEPSLFSIIYRAGRLSNKIIQDYKYLDLLISKTKSITDQLELAKTYSEIGSLMFNIDRYEQGMLYQNKAIELLEKNKLQNKYAIPYFILARVYELSEDKEKEKYYRNKFLKYADTSKDFQYLAAAHFRLGDEYRHLGKYKDAEESYRQMLKYSTKLKDSGYMCTSLSRLAFNAFTAEEFDQSLKYYQKTLRLAIPLRNTKLESNAYGNMGNIFRERKEYDSAKYYYDKSIDISKSIDYIYNLEWIYRDYSELYANMGNFEKAYEYMQMHSQYADSLETQEYRLQLAREKSRIEELKRQQEMEVLSMKFRTNRFLLWAVIIGLVAIVMIFILVYRNYKTKSRQKIADMNNQISTLTQKNLRQQMNPHFVFNTLNSIQYYVFQNDKIAANDYMSMFAKLMRKILENSQHTYIPIKEEMDALELYLKLESIRFKEKFTWKINIDEEIDTLTYKIPTMLIQPYVENSITHGLRYKEGKGKIIVDLKLNSHNIVCSIEDDGIGRKKAMNIKKIKGETHNSLGTTITESRLQLVNAVYGNKMQVLYTDLKNKNGDSSGTRVKINIPIIT